MAKEKQAGNGWNPTTTWQELSQRVESETKVWETKVRKSDVYKRAHKLQKDLNKQADEVLTRLYHMAGLATKADLDKLNRKLNSINRKLTAA